MVYLYPQKAVNPIKTMVITLAGFFQGLIYYGKKQITLSDPINWHTSYVMILWLSTRHVVYCPTLSISIWHRVWWSIARSIWHTHTHMYPSVSWKIRRWSIFWLVESSMVASLICRILPKQCFQTLPEAVVCGSVACAWLPGTEGSPSVMKSWVNVDHHQKIGHTLVHTDLHTNYPLVI